MELLVGSCPYISTADASRGDRTVFKTVLPGGGPRVIRLALLSWCMADDKEGRDEQADRKEKRQREREVEEARARGDEKEPLGDDPSERLGDLDDELTSHDYPATTNELVTAYGEYELETQGGTKSLADVLASTEDQIFDSAEDVRRRVLGLIGR